MVDVGMKRMKVSIVCSIHLMKYVYSQCHPIDLRLRRTGVAAIPCG